MTEREEIEIIEDAAMIRVAFSAFRGGGLDDAHSSALAMGYWAFRKQEQPRKEPWEK